MLFVILLSIVTTAIAGSAAFFSVYGLASTFAGAFWPIVFMGGSLEAGKLVSASLLYRKWDVLPFLIKGYLFSAIALLMFITSVGIYGYLASSYQTDTLDLKQIDSQLALLTKEKSDLAERKAQIDKQIASLPDNVVRGRQKLMDSFKAEITVINTRIPEITKQVQELSAQQIKQAAHTGPIVFIAKAFGKDIDNATHYLILLIVAVFDPLAVVLTVGINIVLADMKREKKEEEVTPTPQPLAVATEPKVETPPEPVVPVEPPLVEEIETREIEPQPVHEPLHLVVSEPEPEVQPEPQPEPIKISMAFADFDRSNPVVIEGKMQQLERELQELHAKPHLTDADKALQAEIENLLVRTATLRKSFN